MRSSHGMDLILSSSYLSFGLLALRLAAGREDCGVTQGQQLLTWPWEVLNSEQLCCKVVAARFAHPAELRRALGRARSAGEGLGQFLTCSTGSCCGKWSECAEQSPDCRRAGTRL